jgi:hypothetical protein
MIQATAAKLQFVEDYFQRFEKWDAQETSTVGAYWRFTVRCGDFSTQVLVPFGADEKTMRDITTKLDRYFKEMERGQKG